MKISREMAAEKKTYRSAELDQILQARRESLKRIRADLQKIDQLQRQLQREQEQQRKVASPRVGI